MASHLWLGDGSSLYDHFQDGFISLLVMEDGHDATVAALEQAAAAVGMPLKVVRLPDQGLRAGYQAGLSLIRPDQHVAWCSSQIQLEARVLLDVVRGAQTAHPEVEQPAGALEPI